MSSPLAILNYPCYALLSLASLTVARGLISRWSLMTVAKYLGLIMTLPIGVTLGASGITYLIANHVLDRYAIEGPAPIASRELMERERTKQLSVSIVAIMGFIAGFAVDLYVLVYW